MNIFGQARGLAMGATAIFRKDVSMNRGLKTTYHVKAYDPQGNLKWADDFENLVVDEGLDDSLDKHLKGSSYTAEWYVGLTDDSPTADAGDTMGSHSGWSEVTDYDEANRQDLTLGSVSGQEVDNNGNEATFTISANNTVLGGAFIVSDDGKGGTSGILYGVGAFSQGDKILDDGDTLVVSVTLTTAAL